MKTALILHGKPGEKEYFEMDFPSPSNAHWLPWLQQKFLRSGVLCQCPEMPRPYDPKYEGWRDVFERFIDNNLSVVVGHSAGAGFALKWLHENPGTKLAKLVMIAPYLDTNREHGDFLRFDFDRGVLVNVKKVHLFVSDDDDEEILESVRRILDKAPNVNVHNYSGLGHFCLKNTGVSFDDFWKVCE